MDETLNLKTEPLDLELTIKSESADEAEYVESLNESNESEDILDPEVGEVFSHTVNDSILFISDGYSFIYDRNKNLWECTKKSSEKNCPATCRTDYIAGETSVFSKFFEHNHPREPYITKINAEEWMPCDGNVILDDDEGDTHLVTQLGDIIRNEKGDNILSVDGYSYFMDDTQDMWRCVKETEGCYASCKTEDLDGHTLIISTTIKHNHRPSSKMSEGTIVKRTKTTAESEEALVNEIGERFRIQTGQLLFTVNGYLYSLDRPATYTETQRTVMWRCKNRFGVKCFATCRTNNENNTPEVLSVRHEHNHPIDYEQIEKMRMIALDENDPRKELVNPRRKRRQRSPEILEFDEFLNGQRGKILINVKGYHTLTLKGYTYKLSRPCEYRPESKSIAWRCAKSFSKKCRAICKTDNTPNPRVLTVLHRHIHPPNFDGDSKERSEDDECEEVMIGNIGETFPGPTGAIVLAIKGFLYALQRPGDYKMKGTEQKAVVWRCSLRFKQHCPAICRTDNAKHPIVLKTHNKHNHPADHAAVEACKQSTNASNSEEDSDEAPLVKKVRKHHLSDYGDRLDGKFGSKINSYIGPPLCAVEGFLYTIDRTRDYKEDDEILFWRCHNKYQNNCFATCKTENNDEPKVLDAQYRHTHPPDSDYIDSHREGGFVCVESYPKAGSVYVEDSETEDLNVREFDECLIGQVGVKLLNCRGQHIFIAMGYFYTLDKPTEYNEDVKVLIWKCTQPKCIATCRTNNSATPKIDTVVNKHSHSVDDDACDSDDQKEDDLTVANESDLKLTPPPMDFDNHLIAEVGEKIPNGRGVFMFAVKGFLYDLKTPGSYTKEQKTVIWRCKRRFRSECYAILRTDNAETPKVLSARHKHNHPVDYDIIEEQKKIAEQVESCNDLDIKVEQSDVSRLGRRLPPLILDAYFMGEICERIYGEKSRQFVLVKGYIYHLDRPGSYSPEKKTLIWRCKLRGNGCNARCRTTNTNNPKIIMAHHEHQHPPDEKAVEALRLHYQNHADEDNDSSSNNLSVDSPIPQKKPQKRSRAPSGEVDKEMMYEIGEKLYAHRCRQYLIVKDYIYNLERPGSYTTYKTYLMWKCLQVKGCKASCKTDNTPNPKIIMARNKHSHPVDTEEVKKIRTLYRKFSKRKENEYRKRALNEAKGISTTHIDIKDDSASEVDANEEYNSEIETAEAELDNVEDNGIVNVGIVGEKLHSEDGTQHLLVTGFIYNLERPDTYTAGKRVLSWKCNRCEATCMTSNFAMAKIIKVENNHNHPADYEAVEQLRSNHSTNLLSKFGSLSEYPDPSETVVKKSESEERILPEIDLVEPKTEPVE